MHWPDELCVRCRASSGNFTVIYMFNLVLASDDSMCCLTGHLVAVFQLLFAAAVAAEAVAVLAVAAAVAAEAVAAVDSSGCMVTAEAQAGAEAAGSAIMCTKG